MLTTWLRKLRGILGTGLIWGLPGAVVGAIGGVVASVFGGGPLLGSMVTGCVLVGGSFFLLGTSFAAALTLAEGRRTLNELSPMRAALWGGLAGGVLPVLALLALQPGIDHLLGDTQVLTALLAAVGSYGALSAALAGGTVAVAKSAPGEPVLSPGSVGPELIEARSED